MLGLGRSGALSIFTRLGNADYNSAIAVGIPVEPAVIHKRGVV